MNKTLRIKSTLEELPRSPQRNAPWRRTLPDWPEIAHSQQPDPVRFVLREPEAKRQTVTLLFVAAAFTMIGFAAGVDFAAWLSTPQPWAMLTGWIM